MTKWQPIETAPKDGSSILLTDSSDGSIKECRWDYCLGWGDPVYSEWSFGGKPTHWMPLPEPPKGNNK